jgi:hypothetical protein
MNKSTRFALCLLTIAMLISCGSEEEDPKVLTANFIEFDGKYYAIDPSQVYLDDYGCDETHCNVDFRLYSKNNFAFAYLELFEFGNEGFSGGSFTKGAGIEDSFNNWKGNYIVINRAEFYPVDGTVTVTKNSNEWTIEFNYMSSYNKEMNGHFKGTFD